MDSQLFNIKNNLLQEAEYCRSPHCNLRPAGYDIELIVIHNISLPPSHFNNSYVEHFFMGKLNPNDHPYFKTIQHLKVSSHIFIRRDGSVIQFVPFDKRAWHAGISSYKGKESCNDFSIGIELEGVDDITYEKEQYTALIKLTNALIKEYPLLNKSAIVGHSEIAPNRKTDPGKAFDWNLYLSMLRN